MHFQMGLTYYTRRIVSQTMWSVLNIGWMDLACVFTLCICLETLYLASISSCAARAAPGSSNLISASHGVMHRP
jgi:hypothetical protein